MKPLKKTTLALQDGLTVSRWSDENYGWLSIKGIDGERQPVDIILSTYGALPIIAKMIRQLEEAML
jgi:hypothetical protein